MKKQAKPAEPREAATAEVIGDVVVASHLQVTDTDFAAELTALDDVATAGRLCESVLELGVRVRKIANTSSDALHLADQVRRLDETFHRVTDSCSNGIMKSIDEATNPQTGLIATAVKRETAGLADLIKSAFNEQDKQSALSKIENAVTGVVQRITGKTLDAVRDSLDASKPGSPMSLLQAGIRKDVVQPVSEMLAAVKDVKEAVEIRFAVQGEADKGTQKGRKFEELTGACLEACAAVAGDAIENTGDTPGYLGAKDGDHVVTVSAGNGDCVRVVFESKDQKLSLKKTVDEMSEALKNRKADVAVTVFSSQTNAPSNSPFSRIGEGRYVVVFDKDTQDDLALRVAYQVARAEAMAVLQRRSSSDFDTEFVLARVAEARTQLDLIDQVEKGLNQATAGVETARGTAQTLRARLRAVLDAIDQNVISQERGAA